ncbi:MAG TPA: tetratricopeptide repeat protein [Acidobacteriaceae bacterium]|nr:tetratricopeptide repeat protein [Acidobacteriaceae bacterium]
MDQQTKAALKQDDRFITTTNHGIEWASENRRSVITTTAILLGVIVVLVLSVVIYNKRSDAASAAFGAAMQEYQTPLVQADQPTPPGVKTYPSIAARAKAAHALFASVADQYGMTSSGKNAQYFAGLTEIESGQTQQAEETLKKVAGGWNSNLAALAKFALAQLDRDGGHNDQAIAIYQELMKKPTTTVPAGLAQLQLADVYQAEGNVAESKKQLADLKDKDAKGPAGMIAAQKLNPTAAGPGGMPPR